MKYFSVKVLFHSWNDLDIKDRKGGRGGGGRGRGRGEGWGRGGEGGGGEGAKHRKIISS